MTDWLPAALDYIPSWLDMQLRVFRQPGCVIAIVHRGVVVLERAFGHADLNRGEALTPRHRFRAASHSKAVTAAGVMRLRETGKLKLDDPVGKYVPDLHRDVARLKIRQLLGHSGGVTRDGADCGYFYDRKPYPTGRELLRDFQAPPLIRPGTRFKYSNQGYGLLGLVIAAASGEAYGSWIKREIIDAVGLTETLPDLPGSGDALLAHGHTNDLLLGRRVAVRGDYSTRALAPASGLTTTARDLATFFAQLSPRATRSVISASSRRALTRGRLRNQFGTAVQYGFGTIVGRVGDWTWFGHTGGLQGYLSRTRMFSAQDLTVSILANSADAPVEQWIDGIVHILRTFKRRGRAPDRLQDWTGRWWGLWGAIDLVPVGNRVAVANPHAANPFLNASELEIIGPDTARIKISSGFHYFAEPARRMRNAAGQVIELWLGGDRLLPQADRASEIER
jgi:CubicO group peptidase (beta-lactamase class C family)